MKHKLTAVCWVAIGCADAMTRKYNTVSLCSPAETAHLQTTGPGASREAFDTEEASWKILDTRTPIFITK